MCTTFCYGQNFFGRNMDIDICFGEQLVLTPRAYFKTYHRVTAENNYALLGVASVVDQTPLYAEAINERGLYMAGLNFPHNAVYHQPVDGKLNLAPYEIIPYLLGNCETMAQVEQLLNDLILIDQPFTPQLPLAPLHFFVSDGKKSLVIEPMKSGLQVYPSPIGVLTNNPIYPSHLLNLQHYAHLSVKNVPTPLPIDSPLDGEGLGLVGLPGDYSPSSRFVRVAMQKHWMEQHQSVEPVSDVFHLLDNVAMLRGAVETARGQLDLTRYSICYSSQGDCWWKVYDNPCIFKVGMSDFNLDGDQLATVNMYQDVAYLPVELNNL